MLQDVEDGSNMTQSRDGRMRVLGTIKRKQLREKGQKRNYTTKIRKTEHATESKARNHSGKEK